MNLTDLTNRKHGAAKQHGRALLLKVMLSVVPSKGVVGNSVEEALYYLMLSRVWLIILHYIYNHVLNQRNHRSSPKRHRDSRPAVLLSSSRLSW